MHKTLLIDLDAHQGNGHERDFIQDDTVVVFDMYNPRIYPGDEYAKQGIQIPVYAGRGDTDDRYMKKLTKALHATHEECGRFDFILYNAGTDCMKHDPLGMVWYGMVWYGMYMCVRRWKAYLLSLSNHIIYVYIYRRYVSVGGRRD